MLPRWGAIQPFDFQAARQGVLFGFWNDPHSVKSLIRKNPGEDVIFVLDEYDFPLAQTAEIPAKWILFSAGPVAGGVAGQNDFAWWIGHEYMGYHQVLGPNINPRRDRGRLAEMSFRYAANRSLTLVQRHHCDLYPYTEGLDRTYAALQPLMRKRFLLPSDRGVRWEAGDGREALWSYRRFTQVVPEGAVARKLEKGKAVVVPCPKRVLRTEPWTAYEIG